MQKFASIVKSALNEMGVKARLNVISGRIDVDGSINGTDYSDDIKVKALAAHVQMHLSGSRYEDVEDSIISIADENRYNPVQEMLDETMRDGEDRINGLVDDVFGVKTEQEAKYVKSWLHQTVAMAFNGGTDINISNDGGSNNDSNDGGHGDGGHDEGDSDQNLYGADGILVLVGEQGIGKTLLISKLAVDHNLALDGRSFNLRDRDNVIINTSHWITEIYDVDNLTPEEKAFITAATDTYRQPYERVLTTKPRRTSFCATVNRVPTVLNRRLWVVDANNLNLERVLAIDEDWAKQLWKQVYEELYLPNPQGFRISNDLA